MTYKMSMYGLKTILITYLNKNPKLEEAIQIALENRFIDLSSVLTKYNSRTDYFKLASVETFHELEENLIELTKNELNYIYNLLPEPYSKFFKTFLMIYDFDLIYNSIMSSKHLTEIRPRFLESLESKEMNVYTFCTKEKIYECLLLTFLRKIRSDLKMLEQQRIFREDCSKTFGCIGLLIASRYLKHIYNLEKLGFATDSIDSFIKQIVLIANLDGITQYQLDNFVKRFYDIIKSHPNTATIYEAQHVYSKCKDLLALSTQVIDLLTLYLVNRYYEMYVLKYILPISWVYK